MLKFGYFSFSSSLAQLYSTSTMEHHHFDQCLMLLNSKGTSILGGLSGDEFRRVVSILEDAILATDLAVYFRRREETFRLLCPQSSSSPSPPTALDWQSDHHRSLLRGMMMTACDLAAITKPWDIQKKVANLVSAEFFFQVRTDGEYIVALFSISCFRVTLRRPTFTSSPLT